MALISCHQISIAFGGDPLIREATLQIERGERIGLLGRNGEGKTTLLRMICGETLPDQGRITKDKSIHATILPQQIPDDLQGTVAAVIRDQVTDDSVKYHDVERLCSLMQLEIDKPFMSLSGGQKRRVLLARCLVREPDVLILDEPTNHLDIESILWLENFLQRFTGCLIFVTHDRAFLQRLATRIIELDRGRLTSWSCDYKTFLQRKDIQLNAEEEEWKQFDKKLAQEEVWIRQGIKARRTRNEGRVRVLKAMRSERSERRERIDQVRMNINASEASGRKVITAKNLSFAYDDTSSHPVINNFSSVIMRGDHVGIIGPNGCGKTTLMNLLLGKLIPTQGTVVHGMRLEMICFDQHRKQLDWDRDVVYNVADGNDFVAMNGGRRHVLGYLQDFLFTPDRVRQPVHSLSGGERSRLLLARLFTQPSNVLVLDEPTNDLDTETLELLEERLLDYSGTVLLASHDRSFLDHLCTNTFVFEGEGRIAEYVGGYSDWQRVKKTQRSSSDTKKKNTSKKLTTTTKKLSNREREEWNHLPERIEQLETELSEIQTALSSGSTEIRTLTERMAELSPEIEHAYDRWTTLDERA